jgi:glycosyltransferase involved in cell wall biosynthesis
MLKVIGARGWKQSHITQLIDSLGVTDSVIFCGYVSDEQLKKEYQSSIALICASFYEGFGLPVIEAFACGCPVIAANNSALTEAGSDCALYFDTENERDLADSMIRLSSNPEGVKHKILAGFTHASRFRWDETARQTYERYKACIGNNYLLS